MAGYISHYMPVVSGVPLSALPSMSFSSEPSRRYLIISPCRDEAKYLRRTLDSVAAQSVLPALWVVVDDGSTDETSAILEEYASRLPYLRIVRRTDRGRRQVGPGVIEAFYAGLETVCLEDFDYVCKLDMDLDLPRSLLRAADGADGEQSADRDHLWQAVVRPPEERTLVPEICGDEMSVGMTKFYRVSCFKEIGGFVRQVMWDGIDCHRARMLGWIAESVDTSPSASFTCGPKAPAKRASGRDGFGRDSANTSWAHRQSTNWRWQSITCRPTRC